ncbi:C6 and C2H2 transcription factor [Aspergillus affinis]|uniref:C6 and C2H2 transcription factor n=1 Tax=Aspergillus affinis TaxID=1070780 RepID=UPI0022FEAC07|nr:C6 and C2H2 transcription factor [Aspergillus affinis]KAI9035494.1 C6 and C2H2 transcription factor [Aspergillus affinis]
MRQSVVQNVDALRENETLINMDLLGLVPSTSRWVGQEFIDIYFRDFHPAWPFLHRGTFKMPQEPCILLQSMVMMGLWIKGDKESRDAAMVFHRKLISAIEAQRSEWYVSESTLCPNNEMPWPMATYQSILIHIVLALFVAEQETTLDLNCRYRLSAPAYEILTALVETCRQLGLFNYPKMLSKHHPSAPLALVWVSVEEIKRFGLALYKVCRLCARGVDSHTEKKAHRNGDFLKNELLTLADLEFCMPDSDELWNAPPGQQSAWIRGTASQQRSRDNRDSKGWISHTSKQLNDDRIAFDWI